jgi:hypothetical protein
VVGIESSFIGGSIIGVSALFLWHEVKLKLEVTLKTIEQKIKICFIKMGIKQ